MDLPTAKTAPQWVMARAMVSIVACMLTWGAPSQGADEPATQTTPPAVRIDSLLNQLYPNQGELLHSLNATSPTLKTTPAEAGGKGSGMLIIHGRKPVLPPVTPAADGETTSTTATTPVLPLASPLLRPPSMNLLSASALRQLAPPGMVTPYVPLLLPSGLDLATLLEPGSPAARQAIRPASASATLTTPRVPLPEKPTVALATPQSMAGSGDTIEINTASSGEIMDKLKLDARRARLIIQFRTLYGPFKTPDDLAQVNGITDEQVGKWENAGLLKF